MKGFIQPAFPKEQKWVLLSNATLIKHKAQLEALQSRSKQDFCSQLQGPKSPSCWSSVELVWWPNVGPSPGLREHTKLFPASCEFSGTPALGTRPMLVPCIRYYKLPEGETALQKRKVFSLGFEKPESKEILKQSPAEWRFILLAVQAGDSRCLGSSEKER